MGYTDDMRNLNDLEANWFKAIDAAYSEAETILNSVKKKVGK